jgi:hypothetical protein
MRMTWDFAQSLLDRAGNDKWKWFANRARATQDSPREKDGRALAFNLARELFHGRFRPRPGAVAVAFAGAGFAADAAVA